MSEIKYKRYEVDPVKVGHYHMDLEIKTLSDLIRRSAEHYGTRPFLGEKKDGVYTWKTYGEFYAEMLRMRSLLKKHGLQKGDRIAIIANNSSAFALVAYGAYGLGGVVVPMYEVQSREDWRFILTDSQPALIVVKNDSIGDEVERLEIEGLGEILVISPQEGKGIQEMAALEAPYAEEDSEVSEDDLCDILYTSGTTGRPRGVELTHKNVVTDIRISAQMFDYGCEDRVLSFLPWAHGFGKTVDFGLFPALGAAVGLAESSKTIAQNLLEVKPTVLCAVPKIFNGIYDKLHARLESQHVLCALFRRAQCVMHAARKRSLNRWERIEYRIMDRLIASKIRAIFGGELKFCVSGGASLSEEIGTFFEDFGIRVFEGYGMTEHAPVISINYNSDKMGSVGVPLPGVEVTIESTDQSDGASPSIGEIVIKSDCIMKGYRHNPDATQEVIDSRGRLHTGDMGYIDSDGYIYVTGRIKEQYKLANGKFVVPSALEAKLNAASEIDSSLIYGAGKPYNVVLIFPNSEFLSAFISQNHLETVAKSELSEHPVLRGAYAKIIEAATSDFRGYECPQRFAIVLDELSIQNGTLTPALKMKRREIEKKYAHLLEGLYAEM